MDTANNARPTMSPSIRLTVEPFDAASSLKAASTSLLTEAVAAFDTNGLMIACALESTGLQANGFDARTLEVIASVRTLGNVTGCYTLLRKLEAS